nr:MAG TPA: hypothetical protein [Caudoviricetes sp.]
MCLWGITFASKSTYLSNAVLNMIFFGLIDVF